MVMAHGREPLVVTRLLKGELLGTLFLPNSRISGKETVDRLFTSPKRQTLSWITAHGTPSCEGAKVYFLLASDALKVILTIAIPSHVSPKTARNFARGLVNYNSAETAKLAGKHTKHIETILGYRDYDEIIHRDNLVLLD